MLDCSLTRYIFAPLLLLLCASATAMAAKPADFTGDGKSDLAVWRPSQGNWYVLTEQSVQNPPVCPPCFTYFGFGGCVSQWGLPGDTPRPADFDGDNKVDMAVWRPVSADGTPKWYIKKSSNCSVVEVPLGATVVSSDLPDTMDITGDGKADIVMFRRNPPNNQFVLTRDVATGIGGVYQAGSTGFAQSPFVTTSGQWVNNAAPFFRAMRFQSDGQCCNYWYHTNLVSFPTTSFLQISWTPNTSANVGLRGDYGGAAANVLDFMTFDPSTAGWRLYHNTGLLGPNPHTPQPSWGFAGDKPLSGDYDNDGIFDQAVWRPSDGTFYVRVPSVPCPTGMSPTEPVPPFPPPQSAHPGCYRQWGLSSDIPLEALVDMSRNYS